jgi:hypothetical protein
MEEWQILGFRRQSFEERLLDHSVNYNYVIIMENDPLTLEWNRNVLFGYAKSSWSVTIPNFRVTYCTSLLYHSCIFCLEFQNCSGYSSRLPYSYGHVSFLFARLESVGVDMQTSKDVRATWWSLAPPRSVSSSISTDGCWSTGADIRTSLHVTFQPAHSMLLLQVWTLFISMQSSQSVICAFCAS